jgi:hypothetical protein
VAGPPGNDRSHAKTTIDSSRSVGSTCSRRRTTKRSIIPPPMSSDAESGTAPWGGATRSPSQSTLTVRNRSSVSGDGMSPETPCLTTIAGGELDSGTAGSCSMMIRLASR